MSTPTPEVCVTKTGLINLLGPSALSFAMYMTSNDPEAAAFRFLFDSIPELDLNCSLVKDIMIPMLVAKGAITQDDATVVMNHVTATLG